MWSRYVTVECTIGSPILIISFIQYLGVVMSGSMQLMAWSWGQGGD